MKSGSFPKKRPTISRTDAPRGTIPNTAEPLPVKCGSSRPAARSLVSSESRSRRRRPRTASKRLPRRMSANASTCCRPRVRANLRWCSQGVKVFLTLSCLVNAARVDTRHSGTAMTARNGDRSRSGRSTSPRPVPIAVPPRSANGTSDPSSNANLVRRSPESLRPWSASRAAIAAAASALPPPMPACAGMRLVSVKRAPPGSSRRAASARAARSTRLSRPEGTARRDAAEARPRTSAGSWRTRSVNPRGARLAVSVSCSEIDWNTVTMSWKPSRRLGPTASPRFSLACAWTVIAPAGGRVRSVPGGLSG